MQVLEYWVNVIVYEVLLLLGASFVFVPVVLAVELLPDGPLRNALAIVAAPFMLVGLLGGSWVAHQAARSRALEGEGFIEALWSGFFQARLALSGLPGIGQLFAGRPPEPRPFDPPDERRFEGDR